MGHEVDVRATMLGRKAIYCDRKVLHRHRAWDVGVSIAQPERLVAHAASDVHEERLVWFEVLRFLKHRIPIDPGREAVTLRPHESRKVL